MGRFSGLAAGLSNIAETLKQNRLNQQDMTSKINLLGVSGLLEGKLQPAAEGDKDTIDMPGLGKVKRVREAKDEAQANYYNALAETIRSGGISPLGEQPDAMGQFGIPESESEDYYLKPRMIRNRGVTSSVMFPERKKELSQKTVEDIAQISSSASDLLKNLQTQEKNKFQSGPGITTRPGAVGDIAAQYLRGSEFTSWKSDVGRAFQKYRKWATGVAAGYPELNMLAPNFPKTTDTPEVFKQKTLSAIDDIERNKQIFLDYLSKSNYAVSQYKSIYKKPQGQQVNLPSFSSEAEAEAAGLEDGTPVMINGVQGKWYNQ